MNSDDQTQELTLNFADVPGILGPCTVRDIWEHKDLGRADTSMTFKVDSHDAAFLTLSDCAQAPTPTVSSIVNPTSGKCLDIRNSDFSNEAQVQILECKGQPNQEWLLQGDAIVNPTSGKCLDINNHNNLKPDEYKDQTKVELYTCNGTKSKVGIAK